MVTNVNRFVLSDESGLVYERTGVAVDVQYQDAGKTLAVSVRELPLDEAVAAREAHDNGLAKELRRAGETVRAAVDAARRHQAA